MSQEKDTTERPPAPKVNVKRTVTLSTVLSLPEETTDNEVANYLRDAEMYARALESPDCPEAFKNTFGALFNELFNLWGAKESDPRLVRILYPIMRVELDMSTDCGTADGLATAIFTLYDVLADGVGE